MPPHCSSPSTLTLFSVPSDETVVEAEPSCSSDNGLLADDRLAADEGNRTIDVPAGLADEMCALPAMPTPVDAFAVNMPVPTSIVPMSAMGIAFR